MASSPNCYPFVVCMAFSLAIFPMRYKIARYYERQRDSPQQNLRQKAVRQYREIERMHRREVNHKQQFWKDDKFGHRQQVLVQQSSFMIGHTDTELQYWNSHQKDLIRAQKLQEEIADLRARGVELPKPAAA